MKIRPNNLACYESIDLYLNLVYEEQIILVLMIAVGGQADVDIDASYCYVVAAAFLLKLSDCTGFITQL